MKIGFDISQTGKTKAGCGFFAHNLIHHLAVVDPRNHYVLYPTFGTHFWDDTSAKSCPIKQANFHLGLRHKQLTDAIEFWKHEPHEIENHLGNIDILHANNFFCPPKLNHAKLVYTLYDLSFMEHPEYSTEHNRISCFENVFKASLNADLIIAISHYTREHFLKTFPHYPAERIVVVYPASRFSSDTTPPAKPPTLSKIQPQQFWLNVGTIEPRKNIQRLLNSYAKLLAQKPDTHPLILAGKQGWMDNIGEIIEAMNLTSHVHVLGYVNNEELQWLYQNCFCLVYPSLFEGFGLPVLEAMSLGAPVITSNTSSLPEVVGKAGILIDPFNEDDILQAMLSLVDNEEYRSKLKSCSLQQAKLFSWEHAAKATLELYRQVALIWDTSSPNFLSETTLRSTDVA